MINPSFCRLDLGSIVKLGHKGLDSMDMSAGSDLLSPDIPVKCDLRILIPVVFVIEHRSYYHRCPNPER